jgi:hypothetical protein
MSATARDEYSRPLVFSKEKGIGRSLGLREFIWRGVLCVWDRMRDSEHQSDDEAIDLCVAWYQEPSETLRCEAEAVASRSACDVPMQFLLRAIFYTGNIAPDGCPAVVLEQYVARVMVRAAVDTILAKGPLADREKIANRMLEIFEQGA